MINLGAARYFTGFCVSLWVSPYKVMWKRTFKYPQLVGLCTHQLKRLECLQPHHPDHPQQSLGDFDHFYSILLVLPFTSSIKTPGNKMLPIFPTWVNFNNFLIGLRLSLFQSQGAGMYINLQINEGISLHISNDALKKKRRIKNFPVYKLTGRWVMLI